MSERRPFHKLKFSIQRIILVILCITFIVILAGCKKDPRTAFIQGVWYYKNAHLANIPAESAQETSWEFSKGYFSVSACCFVKSYYEGNYYITKREENQLTLELYNMSGQNGGNVLSKDDTQTIVIKIDTEADNIYISRDGPYARVLP